MDSESRGLLERQIASRARQLIGCAHDGVLLPPPPADAARGEVEIGTVEYLDRSYAFGLSQSQLLQHIGIFGRSGSGKTNVVFGLLKKLTKDRIPFLFFDTKRTARHLLPHLSTSVNFFTPGRELSSLLFPLLVPPPGLDLRVHISQLVDLMGTSHTLGDAAKSVLHRGLNTAYEKHKPWPEIRDLLLILQSTEAKGRAAGWKASAVRAVESLETGIGFRGSHVDQREITRRLLCESSIVELDGLAENAQQFIVSLLVQWLFHHQISQPQREVLHLVIVFEEGHHFFYRQENRAKESILNRFLRQCREVGLGVVVVDQNPSLISKAALGNTYTTIAMSLKESTDVARAAAMTLLRDDQKRFLNMLSIGEGIVKLQGRWQKPFLVRFPEIDIDKGFVTDTVLSRHLRGGRVELGKTPSPKSNRESPEGVSARCQDEKALLLDCLSHPIDGVQKRYKRLGFSVDRGTRIKDSLLDRKLIDASPIQVGRAIRQVVRPSNLGLLVLGLGTTSSNESIPHVFWKNFYLQEFNAAGYQTETEVSRHGGRVDLLASRDGERIGIEIETGRSDVVKNLRNCLRSDFSQIVIVATTEAALANVESQLLASGLSFGNDVTIVLRDGFVVTQRMGKSS